MAAVGSIRVPIHTVETVFVAMTSIDVDGAHVDRFESIHRTKRGAQTVLDELRRSPMWARQGLDSWVDEVEVQG